MEKSKVSIDSVRLIGCGGVASYLLPALLRTFRIDRVILQDGDILEERNLDRQLFSPDMIGFNKAEALARQHRQFDSIIEVDPTYYTVGSADLVEDIIFCLVDNHVARKAVLKAADDALSEVVLGSNEYLSAQAMFYSWAWKGTKLDPRVRYPDINADESGDPTRPESCQGVAQQNNSQLAMANFGAANYALWMAWYWYCEHRGGMRVDEIPEYAPIEHFNNHSKFRTFTAGNFLNPTS